MTSLGIQMVTYSGISSTSFAGCSGGTGGIVSGSLIYPVSPFITTLTTSTVTLPSATINAVSTNGFPSSGTFSITSSSGVQVVTYSGLTGTSFTGCTGGTGSIVASTSPIVYSAQTSLTATTSSPSTTLTVGSTTGFPNTGTILLDSNIAITYTGTTTNSFTGCSGLYAFGAGTDVLSELFVDLSSTVLDDMYRPVPNVSGTNYDNALITFYKMRGYYVAGAHYETYVVAGAPSTIPPSGHTLINVAVVATWIDDKILVQQ